jgi:hypothetical protein
MVKTPKENTMTDYEKYLEKEEWDLVERKLTDLIKKKEANQNDEVENKQAESLKENAVNKFFEEIKALESKKDATEETEKTKLNDEIYKGIEKINEEFAKEIENISGKIKELNDQLSELYFSRAKARCFIETKEHRENNYKDVIDDCSQAILNAKEGFLVEKAYILKAYACYLSKDCATALRDCKTITECEDKDKYKDEYKNKAKELLGSIYQKRNDEEQSHGNYGKALSASINDLPSPLLMDKYLDSRKRLNSN